MITRVLLFIHKHPKDRITVCLTNKHIELRLRDLSGIQKMLNDLLRIIYILRDIESQRQHWHGILSKLSKHLLELILIHLASSSAAFLGPAFFLRSSISFQIDLISARILSRAA